MIRIAIAIVAVLLNACTSDPYAHWRSCNQLGQCQQIIQYLPPPPPPPVLWCGENWRT